jgi:hypothetical protein
MTGLLIPISLEDETVQVALKELYIHTYYSRFIPEGVAEASQYSFKSPTFYQNLAMSNTSDVTGGKPIAV